MENLFPVFNKKIADQLILDGFDVLQIKPNKVKLNFKVFYFKNTPEFQGAFYKLKLKNSVI
jgi:hypothetical protein